MAEKRPDLALQAANEAIRVSPQNTQNYWIKSACLRELDEADEALKTVNRGLELDKSDSNLWEERASVYMELHRSQEALSDLNMGIKCNPKNWRAWGTRARVYKNMKRWAEAESDLTRAIELLPTNVIFLADRLSVRMLLGKWTDALADADTCLKCDRRQTSGFHIQKAVCLEHLSRNGEAARELHTALSLSPLDRSVHMQARAFFQRTGDQASVKHEDEFLKKYDSDFVPFEMPKHTSR